MFRRRRGATAESVAPPETEPAAPVRESGPWDADEGFPTAERVDLGGLLLPIGAGFEVQLQVAGDQIIGALVLVEESALQVHAFAAPKRSGIWDEVRAELVREVGVAGGTVEEREGPFGTELSAKVPQQGGDGLQPVRYLGIDGPRWFLRAVVSGRAAVDSSAAATLEDVIKDIVVVRGDEPMAPKEPIALRLPAEARQAMEQEPEPEYYNPFERGPEITEIR
ncbi:hypothetical protein Aph01nite_65090 [Acrocarpospora phusangensis]|uniref:DUF3710 domain-containing protein n=1 Tax=Acrocarpospora phusangensis TaxID=1070424 RepID=A0A919QFH7_9ACTN|nr:DUF3710 domain-containing protein [Acrocarpospora phusangensis]GIH28199.1 hypothetical protein Aph01nite_65090 [Acrocarpospora phusangensis]